MKVTLFSNLSSTRGGYSVSVNEVLNRIKTGGKSKELIEQIRASDQQKRDLLKKELPVVLFCGEFSERRAAALTNPSKLICLDYDHCDVSAVKQSLKSNPFVYACWMSPSGDGVKALIKVASTNHNAHVLAILKEFPGVDSKAIKDICRACFMSYDPDIYINEKSELYNNVILPSYDDRQKYDALKKWLENKGEYFVSGNRNAFIAKFAGAANRFGVGAEFLKERLQEDFVQNSDFSIRELTAVVNGIYERYHDQFNSVSADEVWSDDKVRDVLSTEVEANDVITVGDLRADLEVAFDYGLKGGETTHWPELDENFKWMRKEMTLLAGIANFGKSAICTNLLCAKMVHDKQKFALFSPEQAPPVHFFMEFVRILVGKPLEKHDPERMSKVEYLRAVDFLNEHLFFIYPEKEEPTPDYIHARFTETILKYGIDGAVIDPFSALSNDYNLRDDKYLERFLNKSQRFAIAADIYYWIITHPKQMNKKSDGTFERPDLFDLHNGSTWSKRMDNILIYHRPSFPVDRESTLSEFGSIKIKKQALNGRPGFQMMNYDRRSGRFTINGKSPFDTFKL